MSTMDDFLLKAKKLSQKAGDKIQETAEMTKLRLQIAQARSDLDSRYMRLGEAIYELEKSGTQNDRLVQLSINEIEEKNQELNLLLAKFDGMKHVTRCPDCSAENQEDSLFCCRCGASLKTQTIVNADIQDPDPNQE